MEMLLLLQTLLQLPANPKLPTLGKAPCWTQEELQEPDLSCKADMRKW